MSGEWRVVAESTSTCLLTAVIDENILELNLWVLLCHIATDFQEQTIRHFLNVGFVYSRHFFAVIQKRILKCEFGDACAALF